MKGVILRLAARVRLVDLTHEIAAGDIRAGAFALAASYSFFPRKAIHVAVVDPGVGTSRRAVAVQTADYFFVGPDNGVLSAALARERVVAVHRLENPRYWLPEISATFHGRDVFAPVAAHLSLGIAIRNFGPQAKDYVRLDWPNPRVGAGRIQGEVLYVDRFGNAITNIPKKILDALREPGVFVGRKRVCSLAPSYQSVPAGRALAVVGSSGFLEIAINGGNAAKTLKLKAGTCIEIRDTN